MGLTRLLRVARPTRLFVELDAATHLRAALKTLRSPWLAPILAIEAVVDVAHGAGFRPDAAALARIAAWDIVCVRGDPAALAPAAADKRLLDAEAVTLSALQGTIVSEPR